MALVGQWSGWGGVEQHIMSTAAHTYVDIHQAWLAFSVGHAIHFCILGDATVPQKERHSVIVCEISKTIHRTIAEPIKRNSWYSIFLVSTFYPQIHWFWRGLRWLACFISFGKRRPFPIQIGLRQWSCWSKKGWKSDRRWWGWNKEKTTGWSSFGRKDAVPTLGAVHATV